MPGCLSQLSIQLLISAQVMISQLVSSSPASGSALAVQGLLGILSLPLSLPLPCLGAQAWVHARSLKINKLKKKNIITSVV